MKLSQYAALLLLGLLSVGAGGVLGHIVLGGGSIIESENCTAQGHTVKLYVKKSGEEVLDVAAKYMNIMSLNLYRLYRGRKDSPAEHLDSIYLGNGQSAYLVPNADELRVFFGGDEMDGGLKAVVVADRKYKLITLSSFKDLKKMTGADICYAASGSFPPLKVLNEMEFVKQGSINDKFVMANKSLDLVASSTDGDVINYVMTDKVNLFDNEHCTENAGVKYGVKKERRTDHQGTTFTVLIPLETNKESLETIVREHLDYINGDLITKGVIRIGDLTSPEVASVLVDMHEFTAMNKEAFLSIAGLYLKDKSKNDAAKAFLEKGNMAAIARAKRDVPALNALATVARVPTPEAVATPAIEAGVMTFFLVNKEIPYIVNMNPAAAISNIRVTRNQGTLLMLVRKLQEKAQTRINKH
eukprot:GHVS01099603.1.p1 GENE.GHVS01099603.1~~GHVS01099603.1.p1  ORF type:complete len:414 (-),score=37.43 GHVS01099603.1:260-1501(-)